MKPFTIIKEQTYKGHAIKKVEDVLGQEFVFIDNEEKPYVSITDAKRVINGQSPIYEIIQ